MLKQPPDNFEVSSLAGSHQWYSFLVIPAVDRRGACQ